MQAFSRGLAAGYARSAVSGSCAATRFTASRVVLPGVSSAVNSRAMPTQPQAFGAQKRNLYDWALRPYAASTAMGVEPISTLTAGFSKVGLSLMIAPWNALPAAMVILPAAWAVPALFRMFYTSSSRGATKHVFDSLVQFTQMFNQVTGFENHYAEMIFYGFALFATFFVYNFFPEIMLNDFMFFYYAALFVIPLFPLAFTYMPIFASRAYFML